MASFNAGLQRALIELPSEEVWSFHKWVWHYVHRLQWHRGMRFNDDLDACLGEAMGLRLGGDTGECYAGWVVAQGREFYELLLREPWRATERLPSWDDVWEGESVVFLASRVFRERTGHFLDEVFGDDTSVGPASEP
jgi:hypothetical protein